MVKVLPVPRTEVSRRLLGALAARPETMAAALRDVRSTPRFRRLTVGRFFWEIDRLIDAGYLRPESRPTPPAVPTPPAAPAPAEFARPSRVRVRSGRLAVSLRTAALALQVDLSVTESDSVIGGEE